MKRKLLGIALFVVMLIGLCMTAEGADTTPIQVDVDLADGDTSRELTFKFTSSKNDSFTSSTEVQTEFNYKFKNKAETGKVKSGSKLTVSQGDKLIIEDVPNDGGWFISPSPKQGYQLESEYLTATTTYGRSVKLTSDKNESGKVGNLTFNIDASAYQFKDSALLKVKVTDPNGKVLKNRYSVASHYQASTMAYSYLDYTQRIGSPANCKQGVTVLSGIPVGSKLELSIDREDIDMEVAPVTVKEGNTDVDIALKQAFRDVTLNIERDDNMQAVRASVGFILKPNEAHLDRIPCTSINYIWQGSSPVELAVNEKRTLDADGEGTIIFKNVPCGYKLYFDVDKTNEYTWEEVNRDNYLFVKKNPTNLTHLGNTQTLHAIRRLKEVTVHLDLGDWVFGLISERHWKYTVKYPHGAIVKDVSFSNGKYRTEYTGNDTMYLGLNGKKLIMPNTCTLDIGIEPEKGYDISLEGNHNDLIEADKRTCNIKTSRKKVEAKFIFKIDHDIKDATMKFQYQDPRWTNKEEMVKGNYVLNGKRMDSGGEELMLTFKDKDVLLLENLPAESNLSFISGWLFKYDVNMKENIKITESSKKNVYEIVIKKKDGNTPVVPETKTSDFTLEFMVEEPSDKVPMLKVFLSKDKEGKELVTEEYTVESKELGNGILKPGFNVKPLDGSILIKGVPNGYYLNVSTDSEEFYSLKLEGSREVSAKGTKLTAILRPQKEIIENKPVEPYNPEVKPEESKKPTTIQKQELVRTGESIALVVLAVVFIIMAVVMKRKLDNRRK